MSEVKKVRTYENPVQRGFFPDPSVIRVGEDYYMVNSSFQYFPAIPISHSKDMVNWHIIGHAITNPAWLDLSEIKDSHGIWAPDISYVDGKFYIFATLRLNGDGHRDNNVLRRQLVMVSDTAQGPYSEPVSLEVDDIDASHFVDEDGSRYMMIAKGVQAVKLSEDSLRVDGELRTVWEGTGERCPEGPHVMKKDGYYYGILAEGGTGYGHGINVARSRELFGEYECSPYNPVMRQTDPLAPIQRTGHGKLVQDQNGKWWVYYLCGRPNKGNYTTIGRESALDPVEWTEDGWFVINNGKGPSTCNEAPDLPECVYERNLFDDFDSDKFSLEWEFVRTPDYGSCSLTQRKGYFRIWTRDGMLQEIRAKNTLLRREQELCYQAETKLEFYPDRDGEQAGLTCYYSTATYARFSLCYEGGRKLQLVINRNHGEELIAEIDHIKEEAIYLKVEVSYLTRSFYFSYDGKEWQSAGVLENCIYLCDEGVPDDPKRHTGTLVGIYANNGGCGSRKAADFDYFSYRDK
ncbi:glycoside hydrolase family 43 protein [Lachnospiraceae bacterium OttesenSCG-928-D06]|nr:glycoside hydrolase family 43 protein [Lachnospiraceae bacterium OttesenSCG-928-D06]